MVNHNVTTRRGPTGWPQEAIPTWDSPCDHIGALHGIVPLPDPLRGFCSIICIDMITTRDKSVTPPRSRQGSIHKGRFVAQFLLHQKCSISSIKRLNVSTGQNFPLPNEITILFEYLEPFWVQRGHILFWCVSDQIGSVHSVRWEEALRRRNRRGQKGVLRSSNFKS